MKKIFIFSVILFALQNFLFSQTVRNEIQSYINKEADETLFLYNCEKISNDEKKEIYFITVGLLDETFSNNREIVKIGFIELLNGTCINQNLIDFFSIYRESEIKSLKWEKNIDSIHKNFSMGWIIKFNTISEPVIIIEKLSGLGTKLYFYTVKNDSLLLLSFNLNKYEKMQLSGTVTITINNTSQFSYKDLFTSVGFSGINSLNSDNQIIESQLLAINLVRVNPPLFASLYIKHNPSQSSKDLYTELTKLESLPLLSYSPKLQEIANNLSQDLVNNNAFSQFDSKENGLKKRVQEITNVTINGKDKEVCESIIIMRDGYNIIDAIITILQDELVPSKKNRKNLLSKELRYFGMSQMKHKRYDNIIVIEYSNINFN